jgi:hypothetical protein
MDDILPDAFTTSAFSSNICRTADMMLTPTDSHSSRPTEILESPRATSSRPTSAKVTKKSPGTCSCFQQNAELLCFLKAQAAIDNAVVNDIDAVLSSAQKAFRPWQSIVECPNCSCSKDQECLLLALMTVRIVILRIHQLMTSANFQESGNTSPSSNQGSYTDSSCPKTCARVAIGSFEVTGDEKLLVLQVLLLSTVRKIKATLVYFKKMLDGKKRGTGQTSPWPSDRNANQGSNIGLEHAYGASNLAHIQQIWQGLWKFLQMILTPLERR